MLVQKDGRNTGPVGAPPELGRFEGEDVFTLPDAGMAVMTGPLEEQGGGAIVAGTKTAVLRNSVGSSTGQLRDIVAMFS